MFKTRQLSIAVSTVMLLARIAEGQAPASAAVPMAPISKAVVYGRIVDRFDRGNPKRERHACGWGNLTRNRLHQTDPIGRLTFILDEIDGSRYILRIGTAKICRFTF